MNIKFETANRQFQDPSQQQYFAYRFIVARPFYLSPTARSLLAKTVYY